MNHDRRPRSRQLDLPGLEGGSLPASAPPAPAPPRTRVIGPEGLAQLPLFRDAVLLEGAADLAFAAADFDQLRLRVNELAEALGPQAPDPEHEAAVAVVPPGLWDGTAPLTAAVAAWRELERVLPPAALERLRDGWFGRLLECASPQAILAAEPSLLEPLFAVLLAARRGEEARALVRDALAGGADLAPEGFAADREVADLLAEPLHPVWIAALGVVRGTWPRPVLDRVDLDAALAGLSSPLPSSDAARAHAFWAALAVAAARGRVPGERRRAALVRMKRLDEGLHGLYLDRFEM